MYLIYLDESGNSGNNLTAPAQPIFVLCALIVAESQWQALEVELSAEIEKFWPFPRAEGFEIHASELFNPRSAPFRKALPSHRLAFISAWMSAAARHGVKLMFRAIVKHRYAKWLQQTFGAGVVINPHVAAFSLVAQVVNSHLRGLQGSPRGIFISDENYQVAGDIDKSIQLLRGEQGPLRLTQIIEKGFFVESHKSLVLQLCDLFAYVIRRHEEITAGGKAKPVDADVWKLVEPLIAQGDEKFNDAIGWLEAQKKKERPGA
ncbi:MAG: DUF3800 domain-containing protein [Planctomycetes bacterium]|nr:DUF3800 domain-containing protein [Planctomycetota bacterium]